MRKLTYAIACSIDGFIGDPEGDASYMYPFVVGEYAEYLLTEHPDINPSHVRRLVGTDGLPNKHYDTIVQGRASYDVALKDGITSPFAHLREYVASRTLKESPDPHVEIISDDLVGKVRELKAEDGELGIYLCGGAAVAGALIDEVDELIIKTYPVVQGSGTPMFGSGFDIREFTLDEVRGFDNGVVVRKYTRKR
ncbi:MULTISPECIES: dihydrofolate reductase family protein [Streptomyces]|uniref:Dihydrofolate reductase n=1 Tax=Streptomyces stelliscabiei TaxID=146820 RepID=A0A8I0TTX8_9ACTN|nr:MULTISPECIES: dihydrofolate reductase family protein [Streptomyces]KND27446.1 deaminase [Streptomyces stelliscabiei]MBE1600184.1 dihydrofolate reductase [Streptomyces stelliscabiei]MDX2515654.1 dihydrofolate reductase family protein [Streptomyces stelliscabiei]MDX2549234.1 dihydrofolate reductase family protein [Streptomyces stelliscabiei]MDX2611257.1 dihydrofolate reductase family protein [Streptomyces stelliscabiei]